MITEDYKIYFAEFGEPVDYTGSNSAKTIKIIWERDIAESFFGDTSVRNDQIFCLVKSSDITDWKRNSYIVRKGIKYYMVDKTILDNDEITIVYLSKDLIDGN